jgi:hypothetical protein
MGLASLRDELCSLEDAEKERERHFGCARQAMNWAQQLVAILAVWPCLGGTEFTACCWLLGPFPCLPGVGVGAVVSAVVMPPHGKCHSSAATLCMFTSRPVGGCY